VGLTLVEPLADEELNPPGEIEIMVPPLVVQLSVLEPPELILVGLAVKDEIEGTEPVPEEEFAELPVLPQLVRPVPAARMRIRA